MVDYLSNFAKPRNQCPYVTAYESLSVDPEIQARSLHILHLNVRSLLKNIDKLKLLLDDLSSKGIYLGVILLCETFLTKDSALLSQLNGYQHLYRIRENRLGGGISIFVRNMYKVKELFSIINDETECLFVQISIGGKSLCVGEIYRIPNTDIKLFQADINCILGKTSNLKSVIIGSDHNLDLIKCHAHRPTSVFIESLGLKGFTSCITKPTRVTYSSSTLIDNIFCKGSHCFEFDSFVLVEDVSDHYPCLFRTKSSMPVNGDKVISRHKITDEKIQKLN